MYADNFYIAIYDDKKKQLHFPYYVDQKDKDYTETIDLDNKSVTAHCMQLGIPLLYTKKNIDDLTRKGKLNPLGTVAETWLGCPLIINKKPFGVIVIQTYDKKHIITSKDRDILQYSSELIAMAIEKKQYELKLKQNQNILEKRIKKWKDLVRDICASGCGDPA